MLSCMCVLKPFQLTATSAADHSAAMETPIAFVMLCVLQSDMTWSMLQSQTITYAMLQTDAASELTTPE